MELYIKVVTCILLNVSFELLFVRSNVSTFATASSVLLRLSPVQAGAADPSAGRKEFSRTA